MLSELHVGRLARLLSGVSVVALATTAILVAPNGARAETELSGAGITASDTNGFEEDDAVAPQTENVTGTTAFVFGTQGNPLRDAIENNTGQLLTLDDQTTADGEITFDGRVLTSSTGGLDINLGSGDNDAQTFTFNDDVRELSTGAITINTTGNESDAIVAVFDTTIEDLTVDAAITDSTTTADDTLEVQTTGGGLVTFTDALDVTTLNLDTDTTFSGAVTTQGAGTVDVATGTTATFSETTTFAGLVTVNGTGNLTLQDAGAPHTLTGGLTAGAGAVTVNSDQPVAVTASTATVGLTNTTVVLGSGIGATDTVFDVNGAPGGFTATGVTVVLDPGFTTGVIILEDDTDDDTAGVTVSQVFQTYTIADNSGATEITAGAAKTVATVATEQSISTEAATALVQANAAVVAAGTDAERTAFSSAVAGASATAAIESVGTQAETIGGGSVAAEAVGGAVKSVVGERMSSARSGAAYADAGFAGGDHYVSGEFWIRGFGGVGEADGDSSTAGFSANFSGVVVGYDAHVAPDMIVGGFASYSLTQTDGDGAGGAELEASAVQLGFYLSRTFAAVYADATVDYSFIRNDHQRYVSAAAATAAADYNAHAFSGRLEVGAPIEFADGAFFTPKGAIAASYYDAEGYTEVGTGAFNQTVETDSVTTLVGSLGARAHFVHESGAMRIIPEVSVMFGYDFAEDDAVATAQYVGGGVAYTATGTDIDPFATHLGAGVGFDLGTGATIGFNYDAELRSDYSSHSGRVELRVEL